MNPKLLAAKALGFTNAISNLSREERQQSPSKPFGEDYNRLLDLAENNFDSIKDLLPPKATFSDTDWGYITNESYGELYTFSEQLYQMLSALDS